MKVYEIKGCGITIISTNQTNVLKWSDEIIMRGGAPEIRVLTDDEIKRLEAA